MCEYWIGFTCDDGLLIFPVPLKLLCLFSTFLSFHFVFFVEKYSKRYIWPVAQRHALSTRLAKSNFEQNVRTPTRTIKCYLLICIKLSSNSCLMSVHRFYKNANLVASIKIKIETHRRTTIASRIRLFAQYAKHSFNLVLNKIVFCIIEFCRNFLVANVSVYLLYLLTTAVEMLGHEV